ncbi:hypothetical protein Rumeso_03550 [Rubellimicrobium mesophilum DSM 19309]|uniref:Uncharacterized protein n=1 Tax=Rubellimicrobium mesophilum DSM 19309 TaxID=442562 RepID=A0A017HMA1_9RHOB|nr:hypothetical protein [Rubellimicrobium mesophilum]EYD74909.1 hypothetical protein Rumeso_03550 [Rubellimicrobium mesophilum DSM 19309]
MNSDVLTVQAEGIRFGFDPMPGLLDGFTVTEGGREIAPLHRAPWVGTGEPMPEGAGPMMAKLGGDWFCAPFGGSAEGSPLHGWTAGARWQVVRQDGGTLRAVLERPVLGATVVKELSVEDGHPFVYQRHALVGGQGRVPVANHANLSLKTGGIIRTSAKSAWETPGTPQESDPARGRSALRYPARSEDPRAFPSVEGSSDLTRYPWNPRHEDFVVGIEAKGHRLGWTAVARPEEEDLYLSLRDARVLPMTMLWHSNGGRDYAPWSSRHFGCLGVEEGAADKMLGLSTEADLSGPGALTLVPDGLAEVRHVIGAIAWPTGEPVAEVAERDGTVEVRGEGGAVRRVPFRAGFLGRD